MSTGFSRIVRASSLPSMSSWSHAATYQQFIRNIAASSGCKFTSACRGYAPDRVADIVGDEETAALVDRYAYRATVRVSFGAKKATKNFVRRAGTRPRWRGRRLRASAGRARG